MKQRARQAVVVGAIMIVGILSLTSKSFAGSSKAAITVSATVQASISQTLVSQEKALLVTQENVVKGYLDVPAATVLQVKTNDPRGYLLSVEVNQEVAREVWIMDNDRTTVVSGGIGLIHQPYPGPFGKVKEISYRIFLASNTKPGFYAWPLNVTASLQ